MRPLFTPNFQGGFRVLKHKLHDLLPQSLVETYNSQTSNCCQNPELDKILKYEIPKYQNLELGKIQNGQNLELEKITKSQKLHFFFQTNHSNYLTGS